MNEQQPLLQINNLSLAYGAKEILKAVQLTVFPGEILGIVGSSGGGKSTLLKTLTGLLPADAVITNGEILWQGHNLLSGGRLNNRGLLGRKLSMIFLISTADDRLANLHYAAGTGAVRYGRQPAVCRAGACRARFFQAAGHFKQLSVSAFGRYEPTGLYRYGTFAEAGAVTGRRTDLWT